MHWAVDSKGLVNTGGLCPAALTPDNHISCGVKFFFKLHILFLHSVAAFSQLPTFLSK